MFNRLRAGLAGAAGFATMAALVGCAADDPTPQLTWYINADNGGQAALAARCSEESGGQFRITTALLPRESTDQREQLVRRLAANDSGIDLMSLDLPYLAEFANAEFVRPFTPEERERLTEGMLDGPLESALWEDELYGVPFNSNTQLLWVRQSVADQAGLDLSGQLTWDEVIDAAEQTDTTVQVQAARYEGYTVLINSLVASAGGEILIDPEAGKDVTPGIDSEAGARAAEILRKLGTSPARSGDIANSNEGTAQTGFLRENGGFMTNWPFVYAAAVADESPVLDDFAWSRWPAVDAGTPSAPPLGGINLAVGAFGDNQDLAVEAIGCITSPESQKEYLLGEGLLPTIDSVYDDPQVQQEYPMAELLRESVDAAAPRPITPYYPDITASIQRSWHPPGRVNPDTTPASSAELIVAVLKDQRLI